MNRRTVLRSLFPLLPALAFLQSEAARNTTTIPISVGFEATPVSGGVYRFGRVTNMEAVHFGYSNAEAQAFMQRFEKQLRRDLGISNKLV